MICVYDLYDPYEWCAFVSWVNTRRPRVRVAEYVVMPRASADESFVSTQLSNLACPALQSVGLMPKRSANAAKGAVPDETVPHTAV